MTGPRFGESQHWQGLLYLVKRSEGRLVRSALASSRHVTWLSFRPRHLTTAVTCTSTCLTHERTGYSDLFSRQSAVGQVQSYQAGNTPVVGGRVWEQSTRTGTWPSCWPAAPPGPERPGSTGPGQRRAERWPYRVKYKFRIIFSLIKMVEHNGCVGHL